jgi:fibronectin type 3 domain-containing protein
VPGQTQAHVIPGRGLIGIERRYSISFETSESRISLPSNVVALAVVDVPGGGAAPEATVDQGRVRLDWVEPPARADLVGGYRVYRLGELLTPEPIGDTRFDDVAFEAGARYRYTVVGVRRVGTRLIEGVLYRDVEVTAVDRVPPETPTGLRIVPYDGGVFVQWEPGAATDIVRYLVYRRNGPEAEFGIANTDEQAIPFFPDPGYRPGFQYAVSAVDQAGNRSPISEAVSGF